MLRKQRCRHRGRGHPRRRGPLRGRCRGFVRNVGGGRLGRGRRTRGAPDAVYAPPIREDRDHGWADIDTGEQGIHFFGLTYGFNFV